MSEGIRHGVSVALFFLLFSVFSSLCPLCLCGSQRKLDPWAWGGDHVGKPVPEFVTAGECLFCHRNDVGPAWGSNRHRGSVREAGAELERLKASPALRPFADEAKLVLGHGDRVRFLKPGAEYGKLDLLASAGKPHWDTKTFADACAGCHMTGVDTKTRAASAVSLDCFACHGNTDLNHSKDTSMVHLSKKRNDPPRVVTSVCAQCHVRTGQSRSTGRPYPNNFVTGDNLFRDFAVDFSDAALARLNPADRHVLENVRDVVVYGKEEVTCLSCHNVHKPSGRKHRIVAKGDLCWNCHNATGPMKVLKKYEVHSPTCGY